MRVSDYDSESMRVSISARIACIHVSASVVLIHKQTKLEVIVLCPFYLNSLYFLLK